MIKNYRDCNGGKHILKGESENIGIMFLMYNTLPMVNISVASNDTTMT